MPLQAFMLPAGGITPGSSTPRFALWHAPQRPPRGLLLYVHPLAEEMNKTRRMAALQSRALAEAGFGVLQIDLLGCGDSAGDFGDATWEHWIDDLLVAARWLRSQSAAPLTLWGLRTGCLLAAEMAHRWPEPCNFLFWQPATSGAIMMRHLLRHAAATALRDGGGKGIVDALRRQLAEGRSVEVGGYRVHPALASGLEQSFLVPPPRVGHVAWIDLTSAGQDAPPTVRTTEAAEPWQAAASLTLQTLQGPPFWQTAEIEIAPRLLSRTTALLDQQPCHRVTNP